MARNPIWPILTSTKEDDGHLSVRAHRRKWQKIEEIYTVMNVASKIKKVIDATGFPTGFPTGERVECVTLTVRRFTTERKNSVLMNNNCK